ncbi:hypothetical protein RRF57_009653 [Xylaria bambusicola]|uniref:Uncharacterized protein n=1 Tax=Xylaria bambusicola TaxID=326684 RepID=A0AAN7UTU4_9PEZI
MNDTVARLLSSGIINNCMHKSPTVDRSASICISIKVLPPREAQICQKIQHNSSNDYQDRKQIRLAKRCMYPIQLPRHGVLRHALVANHTRTTPPRDRHAHVLKDLLGGDFRPREHDGHAGAGMRASADEVGVPEPFCARPGAESQHVGEAVAQPEDGALVEVELGLPCEWVVDDLVGYGLLEICAARARLDGR